MRQQRERQYSVTLPVDLDEMLDQLAATLRTSKAEVLRRAIELLHHAAQAEGVKLVLPGGVEQRVLVK